MASDSNLVKYLKEQAAAGFGKEEIYQALLNAGWQKEQINEAICEILGKSPEKPSAPKGQADSKQEVPSKSHSIRNALVIIIVAFALVGSLLIYLFYYP